MATPFTITTNIHDKTFCCVLGIHNSVIESFITKAKTSSHVIFTIDISGSMGDKLQDSFTTKIEVVKQSLLEVANYLSTLGQFGHHIYLSILLFNTHTQIYLNREILNNETYNRIRTEILKINDNGGTNILEAVIETNKIITQSISDKIEPLVIFMTDGFNNKSEENGLIISNMTESKLSTYYYCVGIGVPSIGENNGDYDAELLRNTFVNFNGCPTVEAVSDIIIANSFSSASIIMKNVSLTFSKYIQDNFEIMLEENKFSKIDLSFKMPFCLVSKTDLKEEDRVLGTLTISGENTDNITIVHSINLFDDIKLDTGTIFKNIFDFKKRFHELTNPDDTSIITHQECKFHLENILTEINNLHVPESHIMYPFYQDLINKINESISTINTINITDLTPIEFQQLLRLGSHQVARDVSTYVVPTLARQLSQEITRTFSQRPDDIPMAEPPMIPLQRSNAIVFEKEFEKLCCICMTNNIQIMYGSCRHACVCQDCAKSVNTCPLCRTHVDIIKEISTSNICVHCSKASTNILYLPCSHISCCDICVNKKRDKICEDCGKVVTKLIKIF